METYTVDKHSNRHLVEWYDFMTNNENSTLQRLTEELFEHPDFKKIIEEEE